MAGRTWEPTRKGAKDLNRWLSKGKTVYTLRNIADAYQSYEDAQLYAAHTFDRQSWITGEWMTGHLSASGLLAQEGTVYENPPAGVRNIATPGRQYAAPTSQQALDRLRDEARTKAGSRR
jgi:hypothetical protein